MVPISESAFIVIIRRQSKPFCYICLWESSSLAANSNERDLCPVLFSKGDDV